MRRELVRDDQEKRRHEQGGKSWRQIANELDAEVDALKEERHSLDVAIRTMSMDVVRKADEVLKLDARYNQLQIQYRELKAKYGEGVDVQAEVEPEEESAQA
jgi:cell division protein ZapA (FtsZ GTPase activity inhibitor)